MPNNKHRRSHSKTHNDINFEDDYESDSESTVKPQSVEDQPSLNISRVSIFQAVKEKMNKRTPTAQMEEDLFIAYQKDMYNKLFGRK